jgi:methanethiol S-methyltransferase
MNDKLRNDPRYQNHESRPDLAGEHPVGDTYQLIAMIVFIAVVLLDYFLLGFPQRFNNSLSIWARLPFSLAIFALGGWLALRGIQIVFGEYREKPVMITEHMFGWVRHPIYLGAILIYAAVLLLVLSPLGGLAFIGVISLYQWLARDEEKRMLGIFGEKYRAYKRSVPMWLPYKFGKQD